MYGGKEGVYSGTDGVGLMGCMVGRKVVCRVWR